MAVRDWRTSLSWELVKERVTAAFAGDGAGVLEEADAVFVERDVRYGEGSIVRLGCRSGGMRFLCVGEGEGRDGEQQGNGRKAHVVFLGVILRQQQDG
jgi:hypothetical protein